MWKEFHGDITDKKYPKIFYEKVSAYNKTVADMHFLTVDTLS